MGIAALSFVPVVCFDSESNIIPERFTLLAVIFGILSVVCYCLLLHLTTERVREEKKQNTEKFNYGNVLKAVVKNRPLIGYISGRKMDLRLLPLGITGLEWTKQHLCICGENWKKKMERQALALAIFSGGSVQCIRMEM